MPFDGLVKAPELKDMPAILRDRSKWPEGFVWNYDNGTTCALGLARELGSELSEQVSPDEADYIFFNCRVLIPVRPRTVARRIERVLYGPWWKRMFRGRK